MKNDTSVELQDRNGKSFFCLWGENTSTEAPDESHDNRWFRSAVCVPIFMFMWAISKVCDHCFPLQKKGLSHLGYRAEYPLFPPQLTLGSLSSNKVFMLALEQLAGPLGTHTPHSYSRDTPRRASLLPQRREGYLRNVCDSKYRTSSQFNVKRRLQNELD